MGAKEQQILNDFRNLQQVSMIVLTPERGYILGYHSRDEEVNKLLKQTGEYQKDIIDIQTESFGKDRKIKELKELLKEIQEEIKYSPATAVSEIFSNDLQNKINEVLK